TVVLESPQSAQQLPPSDLTPRSVSLQGNVSAIGMVSGMSEGAGGNRLFIPGARTFTGNFDQQEIKRLAALQVVAGPATKEGTFDLQFGNILFAPDRNIIVQTPLGAVFIPGGSIAFIMNTGNEVAIYDLHDEPGPDIKVIVGSKHVELSKPGDFAILTSSDSKRFTEVDSYLRWIAYRKPRGPGKEQNVRVFAGEFSLPSALTEVIPLRAMRASKAPLDKQAVDKIMKNAVIMLRISGGGSPYKSDYNGGAGGKKQDGNENQPQSRRPESSVDGMKKSQADTGDSFYAYYGASSKD
ncbi:MAG: hypothetical protein K2X27_06880, partial [Candidatus Obscuribacterales bacterium]|nr:hypothetical protein [Candidatus Obscuribacterales bacterium]